MRNKNECWCLNTMENVCNFKYTSKSTMLMVLILVFYKQSTNRHFFINTILEQNCNFLLFLYSNYPVILGYKKKELNPTIWPKPHVPNVSRFVLQSTKHMTDRQHSKHHSENFKTLNKFFSPLYNFILHICEKPIISAMQVEFNNQPPLLYLVE